DKGFRLYPRRRRLDGRGATGERGWTRCLLAFGDSGLSHRRGARGGARGWRDLQSRSAPANGRGSRMGAEVVDPARRGKGRPVVNTREAMRLEKGDRIAFRNIGPEIEGGGEMFAGHTFGTVTDWNAGCLSIRWDDGTESLSMAPHEMGRVSLRHRSGYSNLL